MNDDLHADPDDSWPDSVAREIEQDRQASTEEALQAERDERDEAASDYDRGFDLAWEAEAHDVPPIDTVSDLANGVCASIQFTRKLQEHGYPREAMSTLVSLNHVTGPLVTGALQILGCLHSHLREEIESLLAEIHAQLPVMTVEEEEAYKRALGVLQDEQMQAARAAFEAQGIPVVSLDEAAQLLGRSEEDGDDEEPYDSGLN